jgi:hypothetical protein
MAPSAALDLNDLQLRGIGEAGFGFPAFEEHTLRVGGASQQEVIQALAARIGPWAKEYAELQGWADQLDATITELHTDGFEDITARSQYPVPTNNPRDPHSHPRVGIPRRDATFSPR